MKIESFDYFIGFQKPPHMLERDFKDRIIQKLNKCVTILENCDVLPDGICLMIGENQIGIMSGSLK